MGRRGGWLYTVKKVISCSSEHKKSRKSGKWEDSAPANGVADSSVHPPMEEEEEKLLEAENEQNRHAYSVALATAVAAEAAVAAAQAAAEVVRLTTAAPRNYTKTKEEMAAIKIQTVFRGYLARRALKALRGLVRLKSLVRGQSVKRQASSALRYMQMLSRVQSEVHLRRSRISEDSSGIQRQMQLKREKELEKLRVSIGENWDDSLQSKEQIEASLQNRKEAAIRRERALAYAYSHQQTWRNSSNSANQTFMDPNNPRWGWSWLDQWMAARPYENGSAIDKEVNADHVSVKSTTSRSMQSPTSKKLSRPASRQSPSTPKSKVASGKFRPPSPRGTNGTDDDSKSTRSVQSDRCRRHSIAGSSVRDDESLASSSTVTHGYMATTESARAKSRMASPLGGGEKIGTPDKASGGSAKKRLSFSSSPSHPRRHSGPPKIDISPMKDVTTKP